MKSEIEQLSDACIAAKKRQALMDEKYDEQESLRDEAAIACSAAREEVQKAETAVFQYLQREATR